MTTFFVPGIAAPQGSKRAIANPASGRVSLIESSKRVKPWRTDVREAAINAGCEPLDGPVVVTIDCYFPRPKSHFGTGRNAGIIKATAPMSHIQRPDMDKLQRAILDALTGIAWHDDSQVVRIVAAKHWSEPHLNPGAHITIEGNL